MVMESLVELVPRRDKFEFSKPNERGNGGNHKEDEEGHSDDGDGSSSDSGNKKSRNRKWKPNNPKEKRKLSWYLCKRPHIKNDCPKVSSFLAIKRIDEPEVVKPIEKKTSRVNSMVHIPKKRYGKEGLMFVDINITGQKRSALIDTGALNLFVPEKGGLDCGSSS
ncbi:hypothetical protein Golob_014696 [Gossypium lobatum]|uniref:Aspartic peptidase DDI1-type domain-containing protein n=1 Tax=Gossypium lobatum TaxID=34289 RepID=A0A7J8LZ27_9ROSI|nr:hypothetical protein [Gossypium lobatum]